MQETINHHLLRIANRNKNLKAISFKKDRKWIDLNWQEYEKQIHLLASALLHLGLKKNDRAVIYSNTRYEWALTDWACLGLGITTIPLYQNSSMDEVGHILKDCKPNLIFCETAKMADGILKAFPKFQDKIILYNQGFSEFLKSGEKNLIEHQKLFRESCESTRLSDLATLVYTSGTTGRPKGVILTHQQIISEVSEAFRYVGIRETDCSLTLLPYSHVLGRIEHWGNLYWGFQLCFAESIEKIRHNLLEVRPTIMVAVPRIFEKIYIAILTQLEANPLKSKAFRLALAVGKKVSREKQKRRPLSPLLLLRHKIAHETVLKKIPDAFGGRLRFAVSGGAPISKEICEFFHACGVLILEGYGLTETTAAVCVNAPHDYVFGTIGKPLPDVDVKFAADGELLVRSHKVMTGYFQLPEDTANAFDGEYLKTGDIAEQLPSGHIKITDRKKDLIKTAGGKYVAPQKIEGLLSLHHLISHILIHGDQKKYVIALISLNQVEVEKWSKENDISAKNFAELTQNRKLNQLLKTHISDVNAGLANHETVKKFAVLTREFTIESGELTPSMKVKRKFCDQKYAEEIRALYEG